MATDLNDRLRPPLSEQGKRALNQLSELHLAAAYEWFLQWVPRRNPEVSRARADAHRIRQSEYQEELRCSETVSATRSHRDYELLPDAHDDLNAHRDRGFRDLNSFSGNLFIDANVKLVAVGIFIPMRRPRVVAHWSPHNARTEITMRNTCTLGV